MKIALLNDSHFGARQENKVLLGYFSRFFREQFFPYLIANNITRVVHMGDLVDRRKYINYLIASAIRSNLIEPMKNIGLMDIILGNHDTYYKNTNAVNAIDELIGGRYPWVDVRNEVSMDFHCGTLLVFVPWINEENRERSIELIRHGATLTEFNGEPVYQRILFGHLELAGFEYMRGQFCEHSDIETSIFSDYDLVLSGHFHHRSSSGNIHYVGSQYEMTFADYGNPKGFCVVDTETLEIEYVENPQKLFHKIYYTDDLEIDCSIYHDCYVRVIVNGKYDPVRFDMFMTQLNSVGPADVNVIDSSIDGVVYDEESGETENIENETPLGIIRKYITSSGTFDKQEDLDAYMVLMDALYNEAQLITVEDDE